MDESAVGEQHTASSQMLQREVQITFPDTFTYANAVAFSITLTEIRLGFAEIMQDGKAIPRVGITLPPETAASLALVLVQQVKAYEDSFGAIRHPAWKAAKAAIEAVPTTETIK